MIKIQLVLIAGSCTLGCYPCALHSPVVQVYATDVMENITFALLGITLCIEQFFSSQTLVRDTIQTLRWCWWKSYFVLCSNPDLETGSDFSWLYLFFSRKCRNNIPGCRLATIYSSHIDCCHFAVFRLSPCLTAISTAV